MSENIQPQELSAEELDNVAGGASRRAEAFTAELTDFQITTLEADRNGVRSKVFQSTDDFRAALLEDQTTGK